MTDFTTAYTRHVHHFLAQIDGTTAAPEPQRFGAGYVTDMCRCGHERGEHWDGEGTCEPYSCGCKIFRDQDA